MSVVLNGNGTRFWKWKKLDVFFVIGVVGMIYAFFVLNRLDLFLAAFGVTGIPMAQRLDGK